MKALLPNTKILACLGIIALTVSSEAQTYSDFTQVGTIRFDSAPSIGDQPPVAKLIDTDFAGKFLNGQFIRVNEAAFQASPDIATITVQPNTLLTPRPGAVRTSFFQGTNLNNTVETSTNSDMFDASFWCIGSLDDGDVMTNDDAIGVFTLPTSNLTAGQSIEWTIWRSPNNTSTSVLEANGQVVALGQGLFSRTSDAVQVFSGDTLTVTSSSIASGPLTEGKMNTFWVGARVVPEPSSSLLVGVGILSLLVRRVR